MLRIIYSLIIFLIASQSLWAQQSLVLRDVESNLPLVGANVLDLRDSTVWTSDPNGLVALNNLAPGSRLVISFIGYSAIQLSLKSGEQYVYMTPDYQLMSNLTVIGNGNDKKLYEVAGSYAINSNIDMAKFNDESLVRSMNTQPGIRFEERSPNSYRVSIRGNLLRAPFGVRNVKVYWNGIPYTDAYGNTPLNLMDLNNIGRVETIKGPSGSIYGAGIGGVLNITSRSTKVSPLSFDLGYGIGSYGFNKLLLNVSSGGENYRFGVKYAKQKANGYRDHTNSDREVIEVSGAIYASEKQSLQAHILYADLYYETPGGLNQAQYDDDPKQARPGSAEKKSSIDQQNFFAGLVNDYEWSKRLKNTTSIYLTNGTKENPFINNYELEKLNTYGGRTSFDIGIESEKVPTTLTTGLEINYGRVHASNHGNVGGYADTLRYEDEIKSFQAFLFLQGSMHVTERWTVNVGASLNYLKYDINRLVDVARDTSYQIQRTFDPEFMPRIGVVWLAKEYFSLHGSVSVGFSPPTPEEIRTSDGSINSDLAAEKGINYELGVRGNAAKSQFFYDATTFWMQQNETIVSKTTPEGSVVFENAGSTAQFGVELLLGYTIINNPTSFISLLKLQTAYTHHYFVFQDYVKRLGSENIDYSGNQLTGTAPNISVTSLDVQAKSGVYLNLTFNYTDEIPLNDANSVYGTAYQLFTTKLGWKYKINNQHMIEVYFGIDNLLNQKYSLGNDLNAFGGRYFNAAPERNYYGGVRFFFVKSTDK
jgi:iron complex outermembrane receptor protein